MRSPGRHLAIACGALAFAFLCASPALAQLQKRRGLNPEQKKCADCHQKEIAAFRARSVQHPLVRKGECESCHRRHGVVGVLRLTAQDPDLCMSCHAGAEGKPAAPFSHPPRRTTKWTPLP